MDLKSGATFWSVKNGLLHNFPQLKTDLETDVLVIGAGISGALVAHQLTLAGHRVALVERGAIARGSTSASTALLQYEIDTHLTDLAKRFGEEAAVLAYRACVGAIVQLEGTVRQFEHVEFSRQKSLYLCPSGADPDALRDEYAIRLKHGFEIEWLGPERLRRDYGLDGEGAILSQVAAMVDPYRLTHALARDIQSRGNLIFANTPVAHIDRQDRGAVVTTERGNRIKAGSVVIACGYESQRHLRRRVASNRSSYAIVSEPVLPARATAVLQLSENPGTGNAPPPFQHWLSGTVYWETSRPYLYVRSTFDGRIMVGGEDDRLDIAVKRDASLERKSRKLLGAFRERFPDVPFETAFTWAGTFAETEDGLPRIGRSPETGNDVYFVMAYGGNGIVYSALGAQLIQALIENRPHPLETLFGFGR